MLDVVHADGRTDGDIISASVVVVDARDETPPTVERQGMGEGRRGGGAGARYK